MLDAIGLVAKQQVNRVFHGSTKVITEHLITRAMLFPNAAQYASQFFGCFFRQDLDESDVGAFVEDNRQNPLVVNQRNEKIFAHALLEQHAKIFFAQQFGNLLR